MQNNEHVYIILTDVIGSCEKDSKDSDPINWRKETFISQLCSLLEHPNSKAIRAIGDALFVLVKCNSCSEVDTCRDILINLFNTVDTQYEKFGIKIRAVVDKIIIGTKNKYGVDIIKAIKKLKTDDNDKAKKADTLIKTLMHEIYGPDVNKAFRIQSLQRGSVILVTESVFRTMQQNGDKNKNIVMFDISSSIDIAKDDTQNFHIHTPVPITYLKGFEEYRHSNPCYVWHFTKKDVVNEAIFAQEYKEKHSFRFLMAKYPTAYKNVLKLCDIKNGVYKKLYESTKKNSFDFNVNYLWDIFDYFELLNVNFSRLPSHRKDIFCPMYYEKEKRDEFKNFKIKGQHNNFLISNNYYETKLSIELIPEGKQRKRNFLFSSVIMDSCLANASSQLNRNLFLFRADPKVSTNDILLIEPQTLEISGPVKFINDENKQPFEKSFDNKIFLLVFYRYFFDKIEDAEKTLSKIYDYNSEISCFCPILSGTVSGLYDAFILYSIDRTQNNLASDYQVAINKLLQYDRTIKNIGNAEINATNFFTYSYPVSFFLLENNKLFKSNEQKLICLKIANVKVNDKA